MKKICKGLFIFALCLAFFGASLNTVNAEYGENEDESEVVVIGG